MSNRELAKYKSCQIGAFIERYRDVTALHRQRIPASVNFIPTVFLHQSTPSRRYCRHFHRRYWGIPAVSIIVQHSSLLLCYQVSCFSILYMTPVLSVLVVIPDSIICLHFVLLHFLPFHTRYKNFLSLWDSSSHCHLYNKYYYYYCYSYLELLGLYNEVCGVQRYVDSTNHTPQENLINN